MAAPAEIVEHPDGSLGPLLRLWGISPDQIPDLDDHARATQLAHEILDEAIPFIGSTITPAIASRHNPVSSPVKPVNLWRSKGQKKSPPSAAPVSLSQRTIPRSALTHISPVLDRKKTCSETWSCRKSVHIDADRSGSASWAEFKHSFRDEHVKAEEAFTPTVIKSNVLRRWDLLSSPGAESIELGGRRWSRLTMELSEARHKLAPRVVPLKDRVFVVVIVTATASSFSDQPAAAMPTAVETPSLPAVPDMPGDDAEFVVVSVAVRNAAALGPDAVLARAKDIVPAMYSSVERFCRRAGEDGGREVEWMMATASDAKGILPLWLQIRAVPGQIAKDVGYFIGWVVREREKSKQVEGTTSQRNDRLQ